VIVDPEVVAVLSARMSRGLRPFRWTLLFAAIAIVAAFWIANTWSLSSYGIVLRAFGAQDTGLVLGEPRAVRSDEWGVFTPLTQATVNNGFRRFNETSPYQEDLRSVVALPLADWGLAFKPDQWLYPLVNAAYAFSYQHLFYVMAFLAGYALLLARVGIEPGAAVLLSITLFFTAFVQVYWTTFAPNLAYFPWVLLSLGIRQPALRSAAFLWTAVVWLLGYFYPPLAISLAVPALAIYWSFYYPNRRIAQVVLDGLITVVACSIAVFYLRDYLAATWYSLFPGQRSVNGGGIPMAMQWQTLWPTSHLSGFESDIPGFDISAGAVVGTWYVLAVVCFLDYRRLFAAALPAAARRILFAAASGLLLLLCWQSLPIPAWAAKWILFDRVPPMRTMFASGFLLLLIAAVLVNAGRTRTSWKRLFAFVVVAAAGWAAAKGPHRAILTPALAELAVLPVAIAMLVTARAFPRTGPTAVAGGAAALAALTFGPFNPIQSAWPIFNREPTPLTRKLDELQRDNPQGVLVSDQFGATLNGWGYRSAAHVLLAPELAFWRRKLPDMDAAKRDAIFNRFAHIVVREIREPELVAGLVIAIPRSLFGDRSMAWFSTEPLAKGVPWERRGGHLDIVQSAGRRILLSGWAPWPHTAADPTLTLYTAIPMIADSVQRVARPDVATALGDPSLRDSGFTIELELPEGVMAPVDLHPCLVARDAASGTGVLIEPGGEACAAYRR